jgi:biopolymer transport protein ExbB/TolQ
MDISTVTTYLGNTIYFFQAVTAFYGTYLVIVVWRRIAMSRFRSETEQETFLREVDGLMARGSWDEAIGLCESDPRVVAQLAALAMRHRQLGVSKIRPMVVERFQRDILADLEYRQSWIATVIKSAPMLGLLGTVAGMMAAFDQLSSGERVDPTALASNISLALITTIIGLCVAIPLILASASLNIRMRKLEDLVGAGLTHFLDSLKQVLGQAHDGGQRWSVPREAAPPVATAVPAARRG